MQNISQISCSGSTELLPLMQSFSLKEVILYSQSGKSGKYFTNQQESSIIFQSVIAPTDFCKSVNPISARGGGNYSHYITTAHPPDFQTFLWPCYIHSTLHSSLLFINVARKFSGFRPLWQGKPQFHAWAYRLDRKKIQLIILHTPTS